MALRQLSHSVANSAGQSASHAPSWDGRPFAAQEQVRAQAAFRAQCCDCSAVRTLQAAAGDLQYTSVPYYVK